MISFQLDQFTGSDAKVLITLEELANGEVKLIVDVEDGILADIRGIFFNIADESLIDGLTVTGEDVTNTNSGEIGTSDEVDRVGNAVIRPAYYDYGVEIGTSGIGFDDISSTSFIISHVDQELSLEDFIGEEFGVRLTSVGDDREGSSKLTRILEIAPDENTVKEDSQPNPITGNVLFNDSDTSNLFVVSVNGETTLVGTEIQGEYGSLLLNADGSYSYTLDNNNPDVDGLDDGESLTEVFKYTNSDGDLTASAPLTITIEGTNDAPVANADVNLIVEDSPNNPVMGNVLENDVDVDGDMLSVVSVNGETALVGQEIKGEYGSLLLNADGSYSYTLDNNNPDVDGLDDGESLSEVFRYTNSDGDLTASAPLTITIEGTNDAPVANADVNFIVEDSPNNPVMGNVLENDVDVDGDILSVVSVNGDTASVGTEIQGEYGSLLLNADGSYSYTLDNNNPDVDGLDDGESLSEVFKYTNSDGDLTASAPLTITIEGTNDAPVANADVNFIVEDSPNNPVMGNVLENDVDVDGDILSVVSVNGDTASVGTEIQGEYGSLLLNADGSYSYTLDNNNPDVDGLDDGESLSEVFRYTNSDGDLTASAPLTITIEGVSDQPPIIDEPGGDSLSARTPGFWSNHTELWDGDLTNDAKGGAGKEDFPLQDLLYSSVDPVTGESSKGLLIGDFNHDGLTNNNERTLFYSHEEALELVDASRKISKQDARYILGRSLIASWLNNLAGTPSPIDDIQDGIDWLQSHTMDENNDGLGDGNLVLGANIYGVQSKSLDWSGSPENDTGLPSGESIHTALDQYNNFGLV